MKTNFYAAAMLAISAAAFMPTQSMAQVDVSVVIRNAPPPAKFESVPQARRGYVWAPGYWNWDGRRHVWSAGEWQQERRGGHYRPAEWVRDNDGWRLNRGGWNVATGQVIQTEILQPAPPPPRHERMPRARHGYVWSDGHWEWRGQRYDWVPGVWIAERRGYVYSRPGWSQRDGQWQMEPGRWQQHGGRGDRDHDGIPNRYDHDRDNDGVPNRYDHDRDNDGVPNRQDRHPDNPRRD